VSSRGDTRSWCLLLPVYLFLNLFQFGQLKFEKTVDFEVTFDLDSDKTKADGKIHDLTTHVNVRYNGSVNSCGSSSGSREFTNDGSATASIKYYVKRKSGAETDTQGTIN